jgi:CubicO group peptidase (beta-lactamase class C family)
MISAALDRNGDPLRDDLPEAVFPWWSFTKPVIAALVLRRAEETGADLDAPLPGEAFSLRQLMQHRSGLRDYGPLPAYQAAVSAGQPPWPAEDLLSAVREEGPAFEPGAGWLYSNAGYLLLRQWLEQQHGAPLAAIMQQEVLAPLGLKARLATAPEHFRDLHWDAQGYHPGWVYHGCLAGTALEAARLLHALLHGPLLSAKARAAMLLRDMSGPAIPGRVWSRIGYGLGLMNGEADGAGTVLGHTGCGPFSANLVAHFPDLTAPVTVASFCKGGDETPAEFEAVAVAQKHGGNGS